MRFSTVFISSIIVLAGMSAAFTSDIEIEAREFIEEPELYARGGALSRLSGGRNKNGDRPPSYRSAARDPPPSYQGSPNYVPHLNSFQRETDYSRNRKMPSYTSASNPRHHGRRSYYDFAAPQQVNHQGLFTGRSHVVKRAPSSPTKGLKDASKKGVLTADVGKGLPPGGYRLASINTAANHHPVVVPVAQRGSLSDHVHVHPRQ